MGAKKLCYKTELYENNPIFVHLMPVYNRDLKGQKDTEIAEQFVKNGRKSALNTTPH